VRGLDAWITKEEPDPHRDCGEWRCPCGECMNCAPRHACDVKPVWDRDEEGA